jgi:hypothetical protein
LQVAFSGACRVAGTLALVLLGACSGSGDSGSSRELRLSTTSLTFSADSPVAARPASQVVTATFSPGITNIAAVHTGAAIEDVIVDLSGSSAQITVIPAEPSAIGAGLAKGTVALTAYFCGDPACSRLEAGESQTLTATYQISPMVNDVAPSVAIAGTSGNVVIRGLGFSGFAIGGVNFGSTPATESNVTSGSDTQITATYPALTAGTYPVTIEVPTHDGTIQSTAVLTVVDPTTHSAGTLAWPTLVTGIYRLDYDARNSALLVATDADGGTLMRFPYASNAWQAPVTAALSGLRDAELSIDGSQWLAISGTALTPVDPVTLTLGTAVAAPELPTDVSLKSVALINTNVAFLTTTAAQSAQTPLYSYAVRGGNFIKLAANFDRSTARGAANGSSIILVQGAQTDENASAVYTINATNGQISFTSIAVKQNAIAPVLDREATRLILNGALVYDSSLTLLGTLPDTTVAVALRPDGKRAYTYDSSDGALRVFDISETKSGEAYTAIGDPIPLAADPGSGVKMTISPDANTLFIAGTAQIVVQPTPAL